MVCCWSAVCKGNEWFNDIQLMVTESDPENSVCLFADSHHMLLPPCCVMMFTWGHNNGSAGGAGACYKTFPLSLQC